MTKSELYDLIYEVADREIQQINPCDWVDGQCKSDRKNKTKGWCCSGCKYITEKGCSVKGLPCKLWLCHSREIENPYLDGFLSGLRKLAERCGVHPLQVISRLSKEEILL